MKGSRCLHPDLAEGCTPVLTLVTGRETKRGLCLLCSYVSVYH
jgi:hypothetical protein